MRVTVHSGAGVATDVELDEGIPVTALRGRLARLTGDPRWLHATPTADGEPLDDAHPAGRPPLCHGATLRPGPGPLPGAVVAARAPLHVAVAAGPDSGRLLVPEGRATLGPGGDLAVADDGTWLVRVRPRRRGGLSARCVRGRVSLVRPGGRRRPRARRVPRWRPVRWPVGTELRAGASVLVLRSRPDGRAATAQGAVATRRRWRPTRMVRFLPAVAGAVTSAALAAALRQPVLLLGALSALALVGARPPEGGPPAAPGGPVPHGSPTIASDGPVPVGGPADLAALRVALAGGGPVPGQVASPVPWHDDLAVTGPRGAALAAARALLLAALCAGGGPVAVHTERPEDWAWLVWCPRARAGPADRDENPGFVVLDGAPAGTPAPAGRVLRITATAPSWCAARLDVDGRRARLREAGTWRRVPFVGVRVDVAEAVARALGQASPPNTDDDDTGPALDRCPADVVLGELPGVPVPEAAAIAHAWRTAGPLAAPLGAGPGGTAVTVDLVADGPHALVAGTTGSGKSQLLTTLVLGLTLARPPQRLAVLLVDFKGGTGLPALAGLPHVVGRLSDLDAAGARRTLRGLFAELRRRERVVGSLGAADLRELDPADPATPPRLVVVVDEFRVLADELPELLPGLARIAAQGRSLGVHLVLATQRPAGAVPADLRANVGIRVALRVLDPAESTDLVGVPDAAGITRPGLALLARGAGRPEAVQVARAAGRRVPTVRLAPAWSGAWAPEACRPRSAAPARLTGDTPAGTGPPQRLGRTAGPPDSAAAAWVAAIAAAAGGARPGEPWLPPLPTVVRAADVPPGDGLPLALADLPDELARGPVRWDPDAGHLLVLGGPGSGRSTALAAVAAAAVATGRLVHAVGVPAHLLPPGVASALAVEDVTRVARLVRLLADAPPGAGPRPVLLVDDVVATLAELAVLARGAAADLLADLWSTAGGPVAVAAGGGLGPAAVRLASGFVDRLVLGSPDPSADLLAGVPAHLAGPRPEPGRAVHLGRHGAALCQVALPSLTAPAPPVGPTTRVVALPARAVRPPCCPDLDGQVAIGLGGDGAQVVFVDLDRPLLVVGPPGSGRTAALATLAAGAARTGWRLVRIPAGGRAADERLDDDPRAVHVVDDLDEIEACRPALAEALAARLAGGGPIRLLAATTTAHAAAAFRGPVPALLRARRLLVLDPAEPGSADLLGPEGPWLADPRHRPPGRGALRLGRRVVPVQLWAPA